MKDSTDYWEKAMKEAQARQDSLAYFRACDHLGRDPEDVELAEQGLIEEMRTEEHAKNQIKIDLETAEYFANKNHKNRPLPKALPSPQITANHILIGHYNEYIRKGERGRGEWGNTLAKLVSSKANSTDPKVIERWIARTERTYNKMQNALKKSGAI